MRRTPASFKARTRSAAASSTLRAIQTNPFSCLRRVRIAFSGSPSAAESARAAAAGLAFLSVAGDTEETSPGRGELPVLVVENRAPARGDLDAAFLLSLRLRPIAGAVRELKLGQPADDDDSPRNEEDREDAAAAARKRVHQPCSPTYSTCPGCGGRNPFRAAAAATRSGAEASANCARSRRFSSVSSPSVF